MVYGPPEVPRAKREVVHEHDFNRAAEAIYGDLGIADEALYIVPWALQRDAAILAEETDRPDVWGLKVGATVWGPKVLVFYQFDDRKVYLLDIEVID